MTELCPVHCVNIACKDPSFLESHETFILTIIGIGGSGLGVLFAYFLKSRCRKISVCYGLFNCDRTVLEIPIEEVNVVTESVA